MHDETNAKLISFQRKIIAHEIIHGKLVNSYHGFDNIVPTNWTHSKTIVILDESDAEERNGSDLQVLLV